MIRFKKYARVVLLGIICSLPSAIITLPSNPVLAAVCSSFSSTRNDYISVGDAGANTGYAAVQFTLAAECDLSAIKISLAKTGGAGNITPRIYSNVSSLPGSVLSSGTSIGFASIPNYPTFNLLSSAATGCLAAGTYWVSVEPDTFNNVLDYEWGANTGTTLVPARYTQSTPSWNSYSPGADGIYEIDDGGSACGGGGGGGGGTTYATTTQIDNANQDTINIVIIFMVSFWLPVWLFRKRN